MNEETLKAAFKDWWIESYGRPPGVHAELTHVAFTWHIIKLLEYTVDQPVDE